MDSATRLAGIESLFLSRFLNVASVPSSEIGEKLIIMRRSRGERWRKMNTAHLKSGFMYKPHVYVYINAFEVAKNLFLPRYGEFPHWSMEESARRQNN